MGGRPPDGVRGDPYPARAARFLPAGGPRRLDRGGPVRVRRAGRRGARGPPRGASGRPLGARGAILQGAAGSIGSLATTGVRTTPILLTGLAVAISFRAGVFNVGAEGQLYVGAACAPRGAVAPLGLPGFIHVLLALL